MKNKCLNTNVELRNIIIGKFNYRFILFLLFILIIGWFIIIIINQLGLLFYNPTIIWIMVGFFIVINILRKTNVLRKSIVCLFGLHKSMRIHYVKRNRFNEYCLFYNNHYLAGW